MKHIFFSLLALTLMAVSCTLELDMADNHSLRSDISDDEVFLATVENYTDADARTKVYADKKLRVLWNFEDAITIFNKNTYNQPCQFMGDDGDNSGSFKKMATDDEFMTGNNLDYIYAIYPYRKTTKISNRGIISTEFPAQQNYLANSFGRGANTMVSVTEDKNLRFKNAGGYLSLKFYGLGINVASVTLKGNNHEKLAGNAVITMPLDGTPVVEMQNDATEEITVVCDNPVALRPSVDRYTEFWFVLPPTTFSKGITVTVTDVRGDTFTQSTTKEVTITRNALTRMATIQDTPSDLVTIHNPTKGGLEDVLLEWGDYQSIRAMKITGTLNDVDFLIIHDDMPNLRILDISDVNITKLPNKALYQAANVTHLTLPKSLTAIGESQFSNSKLEMVGIMNNVETIGAAAFANCQSLKFVMFESGSKLKTIEDGDGSSWSLPGAFQGCKSLPEISIPAGVETIGGYAFNGCTSLSEILVPASVATINDNAFDDCTSLATISFESGSLLRTIGDNAFRNTCVTAIIFPASVEEVGSGIVSSSNLFSISFERNAKLKSFPEAAFSAYDSKLQTITIPASVDTIKANTFKNCPSLSSVSFENGSQLKVIGESAFEYSSIPDITIPANVELIDWAAFRFCSSLTSLAFEKDSKLRMIGTQAFGYSALTSVTIPASVDTISSHGFGDIPSLTAVSFEDGSHLKLIGDTAFGTTGISTIRIPASVETIDNCAFGNCESLSSIVFEEGSHLKNINGSAFWVTNIQTISIPASVENIGGGAFHSESLTSVTFESNSRLKQLSTYVFDYCTNLTKVTFKENSLLQTIENGAFNHCNNLKTFDASGCASLTTIGDSAFKSFSNLKLFYCGAINPPSIGQNTFYGINARAVLKVPDGSVETYKASSWNSYFASISGFNE